MAQHALTAAVADGSDSVDDASASPTKKAATPLPWMAVLVCGLVLLSNYVSMIMVFPLIPFMVGDFYPDMPKEELGYRVGFLGSAYFVGTCMASIIFGRLADVIGRKKTMVLGVLGTIFAILLFGFSRSFWVALLARFLWGLLNGNLGVVKTALTELCDDSNQAAGFAVLGVNGGTARMIGPSIGSFLSQPASKYDAFRGVAVFESFPYLLPCLVVVGLSVFTLVMLMRFLPETLPAIATAKTTAEEKRLLLQEGEEEEGEDRQQQQQSGAEGSGNTPDDDDDDDDDVVVMPEEEGNVAVIKSRVRLAAAVVPDARAGGSGSTAAPMMVVVTGGVEAPLPGGAPESGCTRLKRVLKTRNLMVAILLYAAEGMIGIVVDEIFPLWTLTPVNSGGFNFTSSDIGVAVTVAGPFQLLATVFLYPWLVKTFGYLRVFQGALCCWSAAVMLAPHLSYFNGHSAQVQFALLSLFFTTQVTCRVISLTCTFPMIGNTSDMSIRSTAYGVAQALVALTRACAPTFGGSLFAWSETAGLAWPRDFHLTFYVCALAGFSIMGASTLLPESVNYKLKDDRGSAQFSAAAKAAVATAAAAVGAAAAARATSVPQDDDGGEGGALEDGRRHAFVQERRRGEGVF